MYYDQLYDFWKEADQIAAERNETTTKLWSWTAKYSEWEEDNLQVQGFRYRFGSRQRHGAVREVWTNGTVREGTYMNGERHGLHRVIKAYDGRPTDYAETQIQLWVRNKLEMQFSFDYMFTEKYRDKIC